MADTTHSRRREATRLRTLAAAAAALIVCAALGVSFSAASPRADAGFGEGGRLVTGFGSRPQAAGRLSDLAVAADGRVAVATAGRSGEAIELAVFAADGSPDRSFSEDGLAQPQLEGGRPFRADPVKLAFAGEELLLAGTVRGAKGEEVEIREYLPDGRPDRAFGANGFASAPFDEAAALFVEPSGQIALFAGGHHVPGLGFSAGALVRFGPDGRPLGTTSPPGVGSLGQVSLGLDGNFLLAAGNGEEPFTSTFLRLGPGGAILARTDFDEGSASTYRLLGQTASGAAVVMMTEGARLVRLGADDRTPDPGFDASAVPCRPSSPGEPQGLEFDQALPETGGKVLLSGGCGLVRISGDGAPDPGFGAGGLVPVDLSDDPVVLAGGGKVLYAAWTEGRPPEVVRLAADGAPDPEFGENGRAVFHPAVPDYGAARDVIALPDGRLLAAGGVVCGEGCGGFALARYTRDGRLDRSFGKAGRVFDRSHDLGSASAVALTPDGEIVAAGRSSGRSAFALAEFHRSGRPDRSFGTDGTVARQLSPQAGQRSEIEALAVQPDGRIVVAGLAGPCHSHGTLCFVVARFLPGGGLDRSFAKGGILRLRGAPGPAASVALERDGRIVVSGGEGGHFVTVRLTPRGRLDHSFGKDGVVDRRERIRFHERGREVVDLGVGVGALVLGPGGSVTVAGAGPSRHTVIERYRPDGTLDRRFGHGGRLQLSGVGVTALHSSGCGLIAAGTIDEPGREPQMGVLAIAADGRHSAPRPLFGALRPSFGEALALLGGRAVVAGQVIPFEGGSEFALGAAPVPAAPGCGDRRDRRLSVGLRHSAAHGQ